MQKYILYDLIKAIGVEYMYHENYHHLKGLASIFAKFFLSENKHVYMILIFAIISDLYMIYFFQNVVIAVMRNVWTT